ncbi:polysaccharide export protein [Ectothiorhodospira shaposhnikovii]|uniref:polysaccharide export protein n=1 Tax=Ectothiorhodospira shaposhnikovii TaxID=1054 RepID=UPI001EE804F0|nr:polysaccharide export protein [Ectothiorhodospira shaposhnikovii]MCG5514344.1 polysaccharide biosynthesis/export family protein [Ectothiorhodospira shaposhnikovii]
MWLRHCPGQAATSWVKPGNTHGRVWKAWLALVIPIGLILSLSACAVAPGTTASGMRDTSSIPLPVIQDDQLTAANISVRPITAELIIQQLNNGIGAFPGRAAAAQTQVMGAALPDFGLQHQDYRLGPGDIISVIVWDHPELTIPAGSFRSAEQAGTLVAEDGTIFYPYVGVIEVAGMTVRELRQVLIRHLSRVIERVQLDVRVVSFRSKRVYVVGEVASPGIQAIDDIPMTLLEAVNRAGGFSDQADHGNVLLTRDGATYRVNVQALYEDGDITQNPLLQHGDIVNVLDSQFNKIFVLGEVRNPGSYVMNRRRATLAEVLSDAGFVDQDRSDPGWIFVMRDEEGGQPRLYHLNAKSPDALLLAERFHLQPRDIVYVDVADIVRFNRVIANIQPTWSLLNTVSGVRYPLFGGRQ